MVIVKMFFLVICFIIFSPDGGDVVSEYDCWLQVSQWRHC